MTWNIRIYPMEHGAFLQALETYDVAFANEGEHDQIIDAKQIVNELLNEFTNSSFGDMTAGQVYECSLTGTALPEASSLSINVYRRRAEAPPGPGETDYPKPEAEAEETARLQADLPEEVASEEG